MTTSKVVLATNENPCFQLCPSIRSPGYNPTIYFDVETWIHVSVSVVGNSVSGTSSISTIMCHMAPHIVEMFAISTLMSCTQSEGNEHFVVLQSIEHGQEIIRIPSTPVWLSAFNEARLGSSTWSLLQCRGLSS